MKRRVIKHGPSTYIVSLPYRWVRSQGIAKGDELEVTEVDKNLVISSDAVNTSVHISADVSGLIPRLADRFLVRAYQKGYDRITITHNDVKLLEVLQKKVQELIGYEIIEQDSRMCVITSITSKIELDFEVSLRRAFLLVKEMVETCLSAYKEGKKEVLHNLYLKDFEVNRMCYFCLRQINKEQYGDAQHAQQVHVLYYLIESLEDLGDVLKKLAQQLAQARKSPELLQLLMTLQDHYETSYIYFYKATKEGANRSFTIFRKMQEQISASLNKKSTAEELASIISLAQAAEITYHFATMRLDYLKEMKVQHQPTP